jgi:hypothetical protein
MRAYEKRVAPLRGFVTEEDFPAAEREWPGLLAFFRRLPSDQRPLTFLELVWRFECGRASQGATSTTPPETTPAPPNRR